MTKAILLIPVFSLAKGDIFVAEWNITGRVHRFNHVPN